MKVVRAQHAGTCYGVERALNMALEAAQGAHGAQTLGPLIHNPRVVDDLAAQGVRVAASPGEVDAPVVIVRSHGVAPQVLRELEKRAANVVDATCPHVLRAQKAAARMAAEGRIIVVVGEQDHPEVEGMCAWAADANSSARIVVVASASGLPDNLEGPVGVVAQTTQRRETFEGVLGELARRNVDFSVADTICNATAERQDSARELARHVDAMVVVGGRNSSNTKRLYEICAQEAPRAFFAESPDDLDKRDFEGCAVVGVTAGASTPESHMCAIEDCLRGW